MTVGNIVSEIRRITGAASGQLTDAQLAIMLEIYTEEINGDIIEATAGAKQQRGDMNYASFPAFTISLTNGVASYGLDDLATRPLTIKGVEVLDNTGEEHIVVSISLRQIREAGFALDNYAPTSGLPLEYLIWDNMLRLFPAPATANVTLTNGLIIYFDRGASNFTAAQITTGAKIPGFPLPYHALLIFGPVAEWFYSKGKLIEGDRYSGKYNRLHKKMLAFIAKRDQDNRKIIRGRSIRFI